MLEVYECKGTKLLEEVVLLLNCSFPQRFPLKIVGHEIFGLQSDVVIFSNIFLATGENLAEFLYT